VLDGGGNGSDATVMAGLEWVRDNFNVVVPNIRVVNMSLGRAGTVDDNPDLHDLIIQLEAAGVTIVVSAGNDPSLETSDQIPAGYPQVVAVASTTAAAGSNQCRFLPSAIAADTASYFTTDGPGVGFLYPRRSSKAFQRQAHPLDATNNVAILQVPPSTFSSLCWHSSTIGPRSVVRILHISSTPRVLRTLVQCIWRGRSAEERFSCDGWPRSR
jgi:hypothetical protein